MSSYINQSESLKFVQKFGPKLESDIRTFLGWEKGRVVYYSDKINNLKYDLDVDACYPKVANPEVFVSVTYCRPDKPGHSNENKLQLKLGELLLLKSKYPNIKGVLVIGGTKEAWLPYVLEAFTFFYDKTIYAWDDNFQEELQALKNNPNSISLKHSSAWTMLSNDWKNTVLFDGEPILSNVRLNIWEHMKQCGCEGDVPNKISNEIIRFCMQAAYDCSVRTRSRSGSEWTNYMNSNWDKLFESRSYFNPAEAIINLLLSSSNYAFHGELAKDAAVPSLIHHLGGENVDNTKVSEDFILYSSKYDMPVFIQSKASGGGKTNHGKNIQNRTKEQLARSLFYRGKLSESKEIILREKDFIWISVLDGDWGVTKRTPLKYIHMLQWAGYDYILGANSLISNNLDIIYTDNPLLNILNELDCIKNPDLFEEKWNNWLSSRKF